MYNDAASARLNSVVLPQKMRMYRPLQNGFTSSTVISSAHNHSHHTFIVWSQSCSLYISQSVTPSFVNDGVAVLNFISDRSRGFCDLETSPFLLSSTPLVNKGTAYPSPASSELPRAIYVDSCSGQCPSHLHSAGCNSLYDAARLLWRESHKANDRQADDEPPPITSTAQFSIKLL